jgi:S-formylglutathione hydrolase
VSPEQVGEHRCFGGRQLRYQHGSDVLGCDMHYSVFLPPQAEQQPVPVLYWLSGLTCTDENFVTKAGAQRYAAEYGIAIVAPDTSPRGPGVPDDPEGAWDFGLGAGFYVNATEKPWAANYQMYDYIVEELPALVRQSCPVAADRESISGHSMGGHGALTIAFKNPGRFCSVSAFSPIVAPSQVPWGEKAFSNLIGPDRGKWRHHDACELILAGTRQLPTLVDQGEADDFLEVQLQTHRLEQACIDTGFEATIRRQAGYDHSYFFIASFIGEHLAFHAGNLG